MSCYALYSHFVSNVRNCLKRRRVLEKEGKHSKISKRKDISSPKQETDHLCFTYCQFQMLKEAKSYYLGPLIVTPEMEAKKIKAMKDNKSPGVDGIPPKLPMETVEQISIPLARVFNLSLKKGDVPFEWKEANIIPLFKKGSYIYIYIYDLDDNIISNVLKFADDTKVFRKINTDGYKQHLQNDLDRLMKWSEKLQMLFNFGKCKCLHTGQGNLDVNYKMGDTVLGITVKEKDLGVTISADTKVSEQCGIAASNGNQILGLIRRNVT